MNEKKREQQKKLPNVGDCKRVKERARKRENRERAKEQAKPRRTYFSQILVYHERERKTKLY